MPKMFVHSRQGTFTAEARAGAAAALTELGIACERLADTAKIRSGIWVFFTEHTADGVFSAGQIAQNSIMSLIAYTIKGGLSDASKKRLIVEATAILGKYAGLDGDRIPAYVVIREVPEVDWGMYGEQVVLANLRSDS